MKLGTHHERTRGAASVRGLTVLELMIALLLFVSFAGASLQLGLSMSAAYRTGMQRAETEGSLHETSDRIARLLRGTPLSSITPAGLALPASTPRIDYAKAVDFTGGAVVWGDPERLALEPSPEDPADGLDNDGDGLVDEGIVVWTRNPGLANERRSVLCTSVPAQSPGEVPGNGVDDNGNGVADEGGLSFSFEGNSLTVELTVGGVDNHGNVTSWTSRRTIALRNVGGGL